MNLLTLAESDNSIILEDDVNGFARAITLRDNDGNVFPAKGQGFRVGVDIDPETGLLVPGDKTAVTVRLSTIGAIPKDGWIVETTDSRGDTIRGRATAILLDRVAGRATMILRKGL